MSRRPVYFETQHRANFQEIDPYGHLSTVHYVSYFLNHRFMAMRERFGLDMQGLLDLPFAFFIAHLEVTFARPVQADQVFKIESHLSGATRITCHVICEMKNMEGKALATCQIKLACVDKASNKAVGWPEGFMDRFFIQGE